MPLCLAQTMWSVLHRVRCGVDLPSIDGPELDAPVSKVKKWNQSKKKFAAQSKCSKCCPSALTQVCSHPCQLMALSTTRCSRPDYVAIRHCIVCYRATFKLVLNYGKDCRFLQVGKRWDVVNWLAYNHVENQLNRLTSDEVIVKVKRVTFFWNTV